MYPMTTEQMNKAHGLPDLVKLPKLTSLTFHVYSHPDDTAVHGSDSVIPRVKADLRRKFSDEKTAVRKNSFTEKPTVIREWKYHTSENDWAAKSRFANLALELEGYGSSAAESGDEA